MHVPKELLQWADGHQRRRCRQSPVCSCRWVGLFISDGCPLVLSELNVHLSNVLLCHHRQGWHCILGIEGVFTYQIYIGCHFWHRWRSNIFLPNYPFRLIVPTTAWRGLHPVVRHTCTPPPLLRGLLWPDVNIDLWTPVVIIKLCQPCKLDNVILRM